MSQNFDASHRILRPEMMDAPDADPRLLAHAFRALAKLNRWSRTAQALWKPLWELSQTLEQDTLFLGDIGCGNADISIQLCQWAKQKGKEWKIVGYDLNPLAIELAQQKAVAAGIAFQGMTADVVAGPSLEACDAMISSLFIHHLSEQDVQNTLRRMGEAAKHLVVVSDLKRSRLGYLLAHASCNLLTRSKMARVDGPRSVAGAFTIPEMQALCNVAQLTEVKITPCWPERYLLQWRP